MRLGVGMKTWTYSAFGGPDNLELTHQDLPEPGPGTVRIKVHAAAVNPVDWKIMAGGLSDVLPVLFPATIGWDVAGVVDAVGYGVQEFAVGDEILADNMQDFVSRGSMAEYTIVPVRVAAKKPQALGFVEAASLPLAGQTALQGVDHLGLSKGDTLLIHNASGGVGRVAVQYAVHQGIRVIGSASESNHDALRAMGAEPVSYGDGLADAVRALAPDGVDGVYDAVGGVTDVSAALMATGASIISIADPSVIALGGTWLWVNPNSADTARLADLAAQGIITPHIDKIFSFDQVPAAYQHNMDGHTRGKVVVDVTA